MEARKLKENIYLIGGVDFDRRLFDSLIPLPDGTSYNAYLVYGSEKTALLDSAEPSMTDVLMAQLAGVKNIDYVISHHTEQDHSGSIPAVLEKYKNAKVVTNPKGKELLMAHLHIPEDKFKTVNDGETLSLGNKTLKFIYTPWVHWPETMSTYLVEDRIFFTCDFFGSHLATTDTFVTNEPLVYEAAKRYFAEIMMPFRPVIKLNLEKIKDLKIDMIAPSHGPVYNKPAFIIDAYRDWVLSEPKNIVVLAYVTMHYSTRLMARRLLDGLAARGVTVMEFDLSTTDLGKLAISLVDAATIVIGTPTVHGAAHPVAAYAAYLANCLRPKAKFATVIGSYGWGGRAVEQLVGMIGNIKAEILPPVLCKGLPTDADYKALDSLAETIAKKHKEI